MGFYIDRTKNMLGELDDMAQNSIVLMDSMALIRAPVYLDDLVMSKNKRVDLRRKNLKGGGYSSISRSRLHIFGHYLTMEGATANVTTSIGDHIMQMHNDFYKHLNDLAGHGKLVIPVNIRDLCFNLTEDEIKDLVSYGSDFSQHVDAMVNRILTNQANNIRSLMKTAEETDPNMWNDIAFKCFAEYFTRGAQDARTDRASKGIETPARMNPLFLAYAFTLAHRSGTASVVTAELSTRDMTIKSIANQREVFNRIKYDLSASFAVELFFLNKYVDEKRNPVTRLLHTDFDNASKVLRYKKV